VGFYSQRIVPFLCDFGLDRPSVARLRQKVLSRASGEILEIGFGTGLNLAHYPEHVKKITTVDSKRQSIRDSMRQSTRMQAEAQRNRIASGTPALRRVNIWRAD